MFIIPFIRGLLHPGSVFHSFLYFSQGDLICDEIPDELCGETAYTLTSASHEKFMFVELNKSSNINKFKEDSEIPTVSEELCWHTTFDIQMNDNTSSRLLQNLDDFYRLLLDGSLLTDAKWCASNKFANTELSWLDVYCAISGSTSLEFDFADLRLAAAAATQETFTIYYTFPITNDELLAATTHILICGFGMNMEFDKNVEMRPGHIVVRGPRPTCSHLANVIKDGILGFVPGIRKIRLIADEKSGVLWERRHVVSRPRSK